ncbi:MAG: hypothetical protein KUG74_05125 [Rhodobacteraceae bacterium]|nr:hypothetical protein [Paracoccaceae bacterium]
MEILEGSTISPINTAIHPKQDAPDEAKEAARKFESLFLSQVVEEMIKTVDIGNFGGGDAEEKWRSFLATAVADEIALQGNTGIAQSIETAINSYKSAQNQGG